MTSAVVAAWCLPLGAAAGAAWMPLVPILGRGSEESEEQPAWTRRITAWPVVVAAGALLFSAVGWRLGASAELVPALVFCTILLGATAIDLRYRIIPNRLVLPGAVLGYVLSVAAHPGRWLELAVATLVATLLMFLAAAFSGGGLGMGDVKLTLMMAAFLGRTVSVALIGGLLFAALPSLVLVVLHGRKGAKMSLALGPFLAAGGVTALLFGTQLLDWYFGRGA